MELFKGLLSEETLAKVKEELKDKELNFVDLSKGEYVSKQKYDAKTAELSKATTDLETLKSANENNTDLLAEIETLKTQHTKELQGIQKDNYVEAVLGKSGAKNTVAAKALISDFLNTAEFTDGKIEGLEDKINELKTSDDYLFNIEKETEEKPAEAQKIKGLGHKAPAAALDARAKLYAEAGITDIGR